MNPIGPIRAIQHCPVCSAPRPDLQLLCNTCWWSLPDHQRMTLSFGSRSRRRDLLATLIRSHRSPVAADVSPRTIDPPSVLCPPTSVLCP